MGDGERAGVLDSQPAQRRVGERRGRARYPAVTGAHGGAGLGGLFVVVVDLAASNKATKRGKDFRPLGPIGVQGVGGNRHGGSVFFFSCSCFFPAVFFSPTLRPALRFTCHDGAQQEQVEEGVEWMS